MSKFDKLIIKMSANPRDWRIDDLKAVAERLVLTIGSQEQVM